jgi:hypothetical protein
MKFTVNKDNVKKFKKFIARKMTVEQRSWFTTQLYLAPALRASWSINTMATYQFDELMKTAEFLLSKLPITSNLIGA